MTLHSARRILSLVLELVPETRSAVDVGCATGTWLSVLHDKGVRELLGLDGSWVDAASLEIPRENFQYVDLGAPLEVDRRFDLAISLEVAEHLPQERAEPFIHTLTSLSDVILFSAAIPGQGGDGHINEQWPDYWAGLFADHDYRVFDCIRGAIWQDEEIPRWYRQNTLLFATGLKARSIAEHLGNKSTPATHPLSVVHPEYYSILEADRRSPKVAWRTLRRSLKSRLLSLLGRSGS